MSERDRKQTEGLLIDAVAKLLAEKGFAALGINAIARRAGVDKVLIYRYFGGLPQLLEAFARTPEYWSSYEEMAGGDLTSLNELPVPKRLATIVNGMGKAFRKRPMSLEAMAWETVESNKLTRILAEAREHSGKRLLSQLGIEPGNDEYMAFALLSAGVLYLSMLARHEEHWAGIPIQSPQGWKQIEQGVSRMLNAIDKG
ncbi:MAG: helix-turn-helix domain-containing protein [Planctomycetota bacterium]